jgi:TonB dependent receptor/CarboxypepD_reg-like domain/TonB-dependent Receptor Plug Domain
MNLRTAAKITAFLFFCFLSLRVFAGTVKGKVTDAKTGEPLVGATVSLEDTKYKTIVNLDGSFVFRNIPAGRYEVKVRMLGYEKSKEKDITIAEGNAVQELSFELETESKELSTVSVTGKITGETDRGVRRLEKNADILQNILSAKTIQLLPDVTVANALQRMSGITIERSSSGEGRYAIIRGMDQRYNSTLVNGVKIPSPEDKYRYVPMDIFPSDLLERLEVNKTLTPSMEGDAIGGTMNLVMKNAPDKAMLQINIAGGYNTLFSDRPFSKFNHAAVSNKSPGELHGANYLVSPSEFPAANLDFTKKPSPINSTIGVTLGNRFFNKKLGVVLAVSYQDIYRGSNSDFFKANAQPLPNNVPQFGDFLFRQYSTQNRRVGINNKFDYAINDKNKISLYNLYVHQDEYQSRYTVDSSASANVGTFDILNRSRSVKQSIYNSTLHGEHQVSNAFKVDWSAVYSVAKNSLPDWAEYDISNSAAQAHNGYKGRVSTMTRQWLHNSDRDLSGYLNLNFKQKVFNTDIDFMVGGLARTKKRDNFSDEYALKGVVNNGLPQDFSTIYDAQWTFNGADKVNPGFNNTPNTYTVTENITAGYVQAKFMATKQLQILGGLRVEHTYQDYKTEQPATLDKKYGTIYYTDLLPSIHLKYALNKKQNIRLSYYKAISRPGFGDIVPTQIVGDYYVEGGNPYVKHSRADNFDLRYELFPNGADQVLLGAFYKRIKNPIEYGIVTNGTTGGEVFEPLNFSDSAHNGDATNYGFEAVLTKYFGKFGVSANYTYTKSQITTTKNIRGAAYPVTQTRPLQGQADHIGNLSLLYKDPKLGLDVQVAFVYTGKRISQVSLYYGLDYWQRAFNQLDFSLEKRITKMFSFYAKVNNITNTPRKVDLLQPLSIVAPNNRPPEQESENKILVQKDIYKISFLAGFRFKL